MKTRMTTTSKIFLRGWAAKVSRKIARPSLRRTRRKRTTSPWMVPRRLHNTRCPKTMRQTTQPRRNTPTTMKRLTIPRLPPSHMRAYKCLTMRSTQASNGALNYCYNYKTPRVSFACSLRACNWISDTIQHYYCFCPHSKACIKKGERNSNHLDCLNDKYSKNASSV